MPDESTTPELPLDEALLTAQDSLDQVRVWLMGAVFALLGLGLVLIYSASAIRAERFGWNFYFVERQLVWIGLGLVVLAVAGRIDYHWLLRWRLPLLVCMLGALLAVLLPGVGTTVNGARRWFRLAGYSIQPSEIAKVVMVVVLAAYADRNGAALQRSFWRFLLLFALALCVPALVLVEPDIGTAALLGAVLVFMLFSAGARVTHVGFCLLAGGPFAVGYALLHFEHVQGRIHAWLYGGAKAYQAKMSVLSLGSGNLHGVGLGQGWAKQWYLPEAHTDFIFAVGGQELGFLGCVGVIAAFAIIVICGACLVRQVPDRFGALLALGLTLMLGLQAAFNIAVVTASVPTKGISLPFVSFGGSGIVSSMAMVGLLCSISRHAYGPYLRMAAAGRERSGWAAHLLWRLWSGRTTGEL